MKEVNRIPRRVAIKSSLFGVMAVSIPQLVFAKNIISTDTQPFHNKNIPARYPAIEDEIVSEVVGASHFNLDRVKELVNARPELARATWDWAFGDWETAIGAASHVGRKDIADFLLSNGARPDIFTFGMLGSYKIVKSMIEFSPGVQRIAGPHGISLLQHVKIGLRTKSSNPDSANKLIDYLEKLGDADSKEYPDLEETEKEKYLGDYKYGDGPEDGFSVKLNMRKMIALGKLGKFGGGLYKIGENRFTYNGVPSVEISFSLLNGRVQSLTVHEPGMAVTAKKI